MTAEKTPLQNRRLKGRPHKFALKIFAITSMDRSCSHSIRRISIPKTSNHIQHHICKSHTTSRKSLSTHFLLLLFQLILQVLLFHLQVALLRFVPLLLRLHEFFESLRVTFETLNFVFHVLHADARIRVTTCACASASSSQRTQQIAIFVPFTIGNIQLLQEARRMCRKSKRKLGARQR